LLGPVGHVIRQKKNATFSVVALSLVAIVMLLGSVGSGTIGIAQAAVLISEEEHWKYHIPRWSWDPERGRTVGIITPQIVIQNETADRLEGFIADANGTRLDVYDGEQVVQVRFMFDNGVGSKWEVTGRVHDGYFSIDIPEKFRDAEIVRIYVGNHKYTVNNGTPTTPQTDVFINAAIRDYRTNSTLEIAETEVRNEEVPETLRSIYDGGSLIDWILRNNEMLPIRSSDSGK
jgi:hypothetical protein